MKEHVDIVFSTILPDHLEAFRHAQQILTVEHFDTKHAKVLWSALLKYAQKYGGLPSTALLKDTFTRASSDVTRSDFIVLLEMVERYTNNQPTSFPAFKGSVELLHDEFIKTRTGKALVQAFEILEQGLTVEGEELYGHEHAREYAAQLIREIDAEYHIGDVSEGDVSQDNDFKDEYELIKQQRLSGDAGGIGFGVPSLDNHIGGVMPGDLVLVGAYTAQGKTLFLCQMAWHAAVHQKKNVFFSTTETVRRQVHSRILARHSRLEKFGLPNGLNSRDILKGSLSPEQEGTLHDVIDDLRSGEYGSILISQNTSDATWDFVESRVVAWEQHTGKKTDLLLIDSIYLLKPPRKRSSAREELVDLLQESKRRGTSMSVPIVSPWQLTRIAYEKALEGNGYNKASFSDTSEAEKSASILLTFLREVGDENTLHASILKNRDGEELADQVLYVDFTNAYFSDNAALDSASGTTGVHTGDQFLNAFG